MSKKAGKRHIVPVVPHVGFVPIEVEDEKCEHEGCSLQPAESKNHCHQHGLHRNMPQATRTPHTAKARRFTFMRRSQLKGSALSS